MSAMRGLSRSHLDKIRRRFYSKTHPDMSGCVLWCGAKDKNGYGTIRVGPRGDNKNWFAHRLSYFLHYGELDEGLNVNHKCDNPECVNPDHLYQGTQAENMRDVKERKRAKGCQKPNLQGNLHHSAKLTERDVEDIRACRESGGNVSQLWRERFKDVCSKSTVSMAATGGNWKYV